MRKLKNDALEMVLDTHSHDITNRVVPYYNRWSSQYGDMFMCWHGIEPKIFISDLELVKQVLLNKFSFYTKTLMTEMATCTISLLEEWENQIFTSKDQCKTMEMKGEFKRLSADILAHATFGSSYMEGEQTFKAQTQIQDHCAASKTEMFIPRSQYLPTPSNIRIWKLDRIVKNTIRNIIEGRMNAEAIETSTMIQSRSDLKLKMNEIIEECKSFFFAGNETTSVSLTWTLFLLCEISTMRLYGPSLQLVREASKDVKLGKITIPKGTGIIIPSIKIHRSKKYWEEGAEEFNPLRFANGISQAAKNPHALLVIGLGPRVCLGQTLAMLQAKIAMALILQKFSFSLSPEYKHTPMRLPLFATTV
ncbi:hypothetical protein ACOSP7_009523 [Xanthoceras sorbifolium]